MADMFRPIPYTGKSEKEMIKISTAACERVLAECNANLREHRVVYTVAHVFLEEVARFLREHPDAKLQMGSLMTFSTNVSTGDDSEKAGNIVPVIELGEQFKLGVKNDAETESDDED